MSYKNFAYSTISTAPSPASSGTSLVVQSGDGAKFSADPTLAIVWPVASQPTTANAEVVLVTAISTDTLTITRSQEGSSDRTIGVGDQIAQSVTAGMLTGTVVQQVTTETGAVATGTTTLPNDDTIPQNTEGDQYMTLAITPKSSTNKLLIEVVIAACSGGGAGAQTLGVALFQDTTANALAAIQEVQAAAGYTANPRFTHSMTSGTTSATTFKVRAGSDTAGTFTFNGAGSARKLGGVLASSIVISEIKV